MIGLFEEVFSELDNDDSIKAFVLTSKKKDFIAGADIEAFQKVEKPGDWKPIAQKGHAILNQIEKSKNVTFVTEAENLNYLRKLELVKRQEDPEFSQFTVSDVVKEGISLLRKTGVKLIERPGGLIPTKRGRVANGPELTERMSTSFSLLESEVNFIYDYLYSKSGNILGGFTKEEFMTDLIKVLKKKYGELE